MICAGVSESLANNPETKTPLNPFGINTSPYGEVFAMAMQGPIDVYWHGTERSSSGHEGHDHSHSHSDQNEATAAPSGRFGDRARHYLDGLTEASVARTNPKPASEKHSRYIRRQIENKLRFAYELDPAHYANYNSYHFFLTEPKLGTRPELTPGAAKLAERTIHYCLKKTDDPRPALTAAAATENLLELMFNDQLKEKPHFTTAQMRQYLGLLDQCIARYNTISNEWTRTGNWSLLSDQRRLECKDRYHFILQVRHSSEETIRRLEQKGAATPNVSSAN